MVKHWLQRQGLRIRDTDIDDEYGIGGGGGVTRPPPAPARNTWVPGRLVQPGEVYEPILDNAYQYTAIQASAAYTAATEPNWPVTPGGTVVDGGVTWQASAKTSITWQAIPLYKTDTTEPVWPVTPGATVVDNSVTFTTKSPYIDDRYCPATKQAIIIASKVFKPSIDGDVTRYCATNDPTDWTTQDDAGFLPTGLQAVGEVNATALAQYRGNLVVWTPSDFQVWQVDPDPQQMALLDVIPGIGTIYARGAASVASDLYFTTPQGVRSVGIASASTNLQDGDVGTPIDSLIRDELAANPDPLAFYNVSTGEWWLVFGARSYVFQRSRSAGIEAWSRDQWPFEITDQTHLASTLYLRSGNTVYRVDRTLTDDAGTPFLGTVWWPYLDIGSPGVTKQLVGIDVVASGQLSISIGYDQTNAAAYTPPLTIGPDTVPGGMVPIPLAAPSLSVKLTFAANQSWHFDAATLWLNDFRASA